MNSIEPNRDDPGDPGGADLVPVEGGEVGVPEATDYVAIPAEADGGVDPEAPTEFIAVPLGSVDDSGAGRFDSDDAYMDALTTEIIVLPHELATTHDSSPGEVDDPDDEGDLGDDHGAEQPGSPVAALWQKVVGCVAERDLRRQLPRIGAIAALLSLVIGGVVAVQSKGDDRVGNVTASDDSLSSSTDELSTQFGAFSTTDPSSTLLTPSDMPVPSDIAATDSGLPPAPIDPGTGVPSTDIPPITSDTPPTTDTSTTTTETTTTTATTTTEQPTVSVTGSFSVQLPPWTGQSQDPPTTTTVTVFVPTSDAPTTPPPLTTTPPGTTTVPVTTTAPSTTTAPVTTTTVDPTTPPPPTTRCSTTPLAATKTTTPPSSQPTTSHPPTTTPPRPSTTTKSPATTTPTTTSAKPTTTRPCG